MRSRSVLSVGAALVVVAAIVLLWLSRGREMPPPQSSAPPAPREAPVSQPPAPVGEPTGRTRPAPSSEKRAAARPTPSPARSETRSTAGRSTSTPAAAPTIGVTEPLPRAMPDAVAPSMPPPAELVAPLPAERAAPALEVPPPAKVFEQESAALAQVLGRYEAAYDNLDASAAAAIWPSVDVRALTRAFARLQEQDLRLGDCTFAVSTNDAAARCAGVLRYAQRIGDTARKIEQHVWTIEFVKAGQTWHIVRVTAQ